MKNKSLCFLMKDLPLNEYDSGVSVIVINILKENRDHDVKIIYFGNKSIEAELLYQDFLIEVTHVPLSTKKYSFFEKINVSIFFKPFNAIYFQFNKFLLREIKSDFFYFIGFESAFLMPFFIDQKEKLIFFEIDSLSLYYKRALFQTINPLKILYYTSQYVLVNRCEKSFYKIASKVLFVSNVDKIFSIKQNLKITNTKFMDIKLGVSTPSHTKCIINNINAQYNICFTGILDYKPNLLAAEFIVDKLSKIFLHNNFSVKFHIIGPYSQNTLKKFKIYNLSNVVFTGFVDDMDSYMTSMDLFISPLFIGSGMKNKILKAMSLGLPIVCSSLSIDGIDEMKNNDNCIVCYSNDSNEWYTKIIDLLSDHDRMKEFSNKTKDIINKSYSWKSITNDFFNKTIH
ncbi:glycosyltransferase [Flavobacterium sp.]|uniref:glycosyltransferase n=1 Tax=Flavobacterium sp. TaxID=239 RepID=UPI0022BF3D10|nr:glycosyltransferase [Flavobacterium sp.]MCZ8230041.1 glycosyltransferase [Flavobacterium sp.]